MGTFLTYVKGACKSFTMWFNGLVAGALALVPVLQDQIPQLHDFLTPSLYKNLTGLLIIGNIILRVKTNNSLVDKASKLEDKA